MIVFIKKDKRKYDIVHGTRNGEEVKIDSLICSLDLCFSPATNKFNYIVDFIEDCSLVVGDEFNNWFDNYIKEYITSKYDAAIIKKHIPILMAFVDKYIEVKNIKFDDYIDMKKISNNSIFFDADEIKKLVQVSNYLKLYFIKSAI